MLTRCPNCQKAIVIPDYGAQDCPRCAARVWFADPQSAQEDKVLIDPQALGERLRKEGEFKLPNAVRELFLAPAKSRLAPFEDRTQPNQWRALWQTFSQSLLFPGPFFYSLKQQAPLYGALFYGWAFNTLGYIFMCAWQIYLLPDLLQGGKEGVTAANQAELLRQLEIAWGMLCAAPLLAFFSLFFNSSLYHFVLRSMNGRDKTPSYRATLRGVAYSSSPLVLMAIPFIGLFLAKFWSIMTTVVALTRVHETSTLRAVVAYLFPTVFFLLLVLLTSRLVDEELASSMLELLK